MTVLFLQHIVLTPYRWGMSENALEGGVHGPVDPESRPTMWGLSRRVDNVETHLRLMQATLARISNSLIAIMLLIIGGMVTALFTMFGG